MICPKCKSEDQFGNFCSECGNRLKEKCPECGKMEPIGRKVCETKLEEAQNEMYKFVVLRIRDLPDGDTYQPFSYVFIVPVVTFGVIAVFCFFFGIFVFPFSESPEKITWTIISWIIGFLALAACRLVIFFADKYFAKNIKKMKLDEQKATQKFLQENPGYAEILRKAEM